MTSNVARITGPQDPPYLPNTEEGLEDDERRRPTLNEVPLGYSYTAAWLNSDENWIVFRKFGGLQARVLLTQQADIEAKERQLRIIDRQEEDQVRRTGGLSHNRTWLGDENTERKKLIEDLAIRIRRYQKDLLLYRQMLRLPKAQKWQKKNYKNMLDDKAPFFKLERRFLDDFGDLIALRGEAEDSIDLLEPISEKLVKVLELFGRVFLRKKPPPEFEGSDAVTAQSERGMNAIARFFFGVIVSTIIVVGVIVLHFVKSDIGRLIVLCCATLICSVLTSLLTKAKKSEVFGISAAYCAVLVVFVGTTVNQDPNLVNLQYGNLTINGTITSSG